MASIDAGLILFALLYGGFLILCLVVAYRRYKALAAKARKPKLILLQGGKKDRGPYDKESR